MPPPDDLDLLSPAEVEGLVVQLWEQIIELRRLVAALRDENARLKSGAGRPNIKPNSKQGVWSRRSIQSRRAAPTSDAGAAARERS